MSLFEKKMLFIALCCVKPLIHDSNFLFLENSFYILLHCPTVPRSSNPTYNATSYSFSLVE